MISTKILRLLFTPALMACASSLECSSDASYLGGIQQEQSNWSYLQENLAKQEIEHTGFSNTVGFVLNDYAACISIPVVGAIGVEMGREFILMLLFKGGNFGEYQKVVVSAFHALTIGASVFSGLAFYGLCKVIGRWLQARPALCKKVLTAYVAEWQINKPNTPEVLHPMFEAMHAEFMKSPNISSITEQQACQIVESLLAVSTVLVTTN